MLSKSSGKRRQLVFCDNDINRGDQIFLDIGNHHPVSLSGDFLYSVAIGDEGEVIFINKKTVKISPNSPIEAAYLPDGEKVSSVACCRSVFCITGEEASSVLIGRSPPPKTPNLKICEYE